MDVVLGLIVIVFLPGLECLDSLGGLAALPSDAVMDMVDRLVMDIVLEEEDLAEVVGGGGAGGSLVIVTSGVGEQMLLGAEGEGGCGGGVDWGLLVEAVLGAAEPEDGTPPAASAGDEEDRTGEEATGAEGPPKRVA